jgi:hypothetical protein
MDLNTYNQIIEYLMDHNFPPNGTNERRRQLRQQANHYMVQDNILFKRNQNGNPLRVITTENVTEILYNMHDAPSAGHFGIRATTDRTRQ